MTITFLCEHCHKEVKGPDAAAGKRGKCPYCGHSSYVPYPGEDQKDIPLAPVDTEAERLREEEIRRLASLERDLRSELPGDLPPVPLGQRGDLTSEDLHHFVVNYCLDMSAGLLERADQHAAKLKEFRYLGHQAVEDFLTGKAAEESLSLGNIPPKVLEGLLKRLSKQLT